MFTTCSVCRPVMSAVLGAVMVTTAGCTSGLNHPDMWVPAWITLSDLDAQVRSFDDIKYFDDSPSVGRFPTSIAVVRLNSPRTAPGTLEILPFRLYEPPFWTELFDGTPQVRSVFFLHEKSVRSQTVTVPQLLHAADVSNAGLLLMYGYNNSHAGQCNVVGLLYEIPSGKVLAGINHTATEDQARLAAAELPEKFQPSTAGDHEFFVDYVAFRAFEDKFRNCVWHLIDIDQAQQQLQPNPFRDPRPRYPRTAAATTP